MKLFMMSSLSLYIYIYIYKFKLQICINFFNEKFVIIKIKIILYIIFFLFKQVNLLFFRI